MRKYVLVWLICHNFCCGHITTPPTSFAVGVCHRPGDLLCQHIIHLGICAVCFPSYIVTLTFWWKPWIGAHVNGTSRTRYTPLDIAVRNGHVEVAQVPRSFGEPRYMLFLLPAMCYGTCDWNPYTTIRANTPFVVHYVSYASSEIRVGRVEELWMALVSYSFLLVLYWIAVVYKSMVHQHDSFAHCV